MRTHVSFQSTFSQERGPSDEPEGRELAVYIASALRDAGYTVEQPANHEHWAWQWACGNAKTTHMITLALVGDGVLEWLLLVEPRVNTARRLLAKVGFNAGQAETPELAALCKAIHDLLRGDGRFQSIRWYSAEEWDSDPEAHWARTP
jgi:hypothetical protein